MKNIIIIAIVFIWSGFILALSFIETPLKFKAPNVTLEIGLGIGQLIFNALNKIEIFFSLVLIFLSRGAINKKIWLFFIIALVILLLQTVWLLPELGQRADLIINHQKPKDSYHHILFIILEATKLISLLVFGYTFTKNILK